MLLQCETVTILEKYCLVIILRKHYLIQFYEVSSCLGTSIFDEQVSVDPQDPEKTYMSTAYHDC